MTALLLAALSAASLAAQDDALRAQGREVEGAILRGVAQERQERA